MKTYPIVFSPQMVRALLAGRKTMTRRLARAGGPHASPWRQIADGDRLWVREGLKRTPDSSWRYAADGEAIFKDRDDPKIAAMVVWARHKERNVAPSIHMPRWASRLTLVVAATKVERLQDISYADVLAEGCPPIQRTNEPDLVSDVASCRSWFHELWDQLHGPGAWNADPEVIAISFAVHKANVDRMAEAA